MTSQRLKHTLYLLIVGPHLAIVDGVNAFTKRTHRGLTTKNAARASTKCIHHSVRRGAFHQHHDSYFGLCGLQLAGELQAIALVALKTGAQKNHLRTKFSDYVAKFRSSADSCQYIDMSIILQRARQ